MGLCRGRSIGHHPRRIGGRCVRSHRSLRRPEDRRIVGPILRPAHLSGFRRPSEAAGLTLQPLVEHDAGRQGLGDHRRLPGQLHHFEEILRRPFANQTNEPHEALTLRILAGEEVHLE